MSYTGSPTTLVMSLCYRGVEEHELIGVTTAYVELKRNNYGIWQVIVPARSFAARIIIAAVAAGEILAGDWSVRFAYPDDPAATIASGPITTVSLVSGRAAGYSADTVTFWGVTEETHLRERVILPDPTVTLPLSNSTGTGGTFPVTSHTLTGPAENLLLAYVRAHLGAAALPYRRLPWATLLVPADRGVGPVVTAAPTATTNLLDQCRDLAALAGTSFDLRQTGNGALTFAVRSSVTRSGIILSVPGGTAEGIVVKQQRRPKTEIIAQGSGDDPSTLYIRRAATDTPSNGWAELREEHLGASGDTAGELIPKADAELLEDGPELAFTTSPAPDAPWRVGVDFHLGDFLIHETDDFTVAAPVESVILSHENGRLTQKFSVSLDQDDDGIAVILNQINRALRNR